MTATEITTRLEVQSVTIRKGSLHDVTLSPYEWWNDDEYKDLSDEELDRIYEEREDAHEGFGFTKDSVTIQTDEPLRLGQIVELALRVIE